jgi:hypothetical protein
MTAIFKPAALIATLAIGTVVPAQAQEIDCDDRDCGARPPSEAEIIQFQRALERNPQAREQLVVALQEGNTRQAHAITGRLIDIGGIQAIGGPYCEALGLYLPPFLCMIYSDVDFDEPTQ